MIINLLEYGPKSENVGKIMRALSVLEYRRNDELIKIEQLFMKIHLPTIKGPTHRSQFRLNAPLQLKNDIPKLAIK